MNTAEQIQITDENELIEAWRFEALERAGYDVDAAAQLSVRLDIDLHFAAGLLERGCSQQLALEILL